MQELACNTNELVHIQWNNLKTVLTDVCNNNLKADEATKKKNWMTDHILSLMDERRKHKKNDSQYKYLQRTIRREIKRAKEEWMRGQCEELEGYDQSHKRLPCIKN